ncbi:conserved hypothetical protein [Halobacteriovorax marinus SJ]|uniref:FecR protein domain-containing protein n=1 Tax=Halobacteriovorax marinus (strain ATCC BAA-682 / DSM 15412 / SJ) TaxID=862908 RepID=E1WXQ5_HALMS|nr:FecR family protein [Halobacteriovorax marinus]CBW25861.1 conserved hypothetical protein [Halobacteriovorax marinus SJ]
MFKIFITLFIIFNIQANDVGQILYVKGIVKVKTGENVSNAEKGSPLKNKSIIQSGKDSLAIISLSDGSKIKLNSESKIIVSISKNEPPQVGLFNGSSFFSVLKSKVMKQDKFIVKTKNAALGVRGTQFFVSYGKKSGQDEWMCVNEGEVAVRPKGKATKVLVKKGEGVQIKSKQEVSTPKPLAWTQKLNWNFNENSSELENKVNIEDAYTDILDQDYD